MPGNEKEVAKFLVLRKGKIALKYLGVVNLIEVPVRSGKGSIEINDAKDVEHCLSTQDSRKKADIYINHRGISIKQCGASFLYNRLQRAEVIKIFTHLRFKNAEFILLSLDREVKSFHLGNLTGDNLVAERRDEPDLVHFFQVEPGNQLFQVFQRSSLQRAGLESLIFFLQLG